MMKMINIDSLTIRAFVAENFDYFVNAKIQKIQQPTRKELLLTMRNHSETKKLYINISAEFYHLCFINKNTEQKREIKQPQAPPMFCMLLRKHFEGAKIINVKAVDGERIVEITFENYNEFSDKTTYCLAIELMGKHSNIVLYNYETKAIIGCAHNIGPEKSRDRELIGGYPYIYPPVQQKKYLEATPFNDFFREIKSSIEKIHILMSDNYYYLTRALAERLCRKYLKNYDTATAFNPDELENLYKKTVEYLTTEKYSPCCDSNYSYYALFDDSELTVKFDSVNQMIDEFFTHNYSKFLFSALQNSLENRLNKDLRKNKATLAKFEKNFKKSEKAEGYKLKADLIMGNLYVLKGLIDKVELADFTTGEKVLVNLDTTKTPVENANNYYRLYNKAKKALEIESELIQTEEEKVKLLQDYLFSVANSDTYSELQQIEEEISPQNAKQKDKKAAKQEIEIPKREINGFAVYIGKNNKQNDYIYSKISAPEDLWFHALNMPGAHILLKAEKNKPVDNDTLYKCAELAKEYSNGKSSGKVSIIYTKRQFLRRPPNTHSGYVTFKNEAEIVVE